MDLKELEKKYIQIVERFNKIEGTDWKGEAATFELMKQVGELSKWIMMKEKYYAFVEDDEVALKHVGNELADIMAQVIRIAHIYDIDLENAFIDARRDENDYLQTRGV